MGEPHRLDEFEVRRQALDRQQQRVLEIDGHDMEEMSQAFSEARRERFKPTVIIAHTIKGRGVPYMENLPAWHGSVNLSREDCGRALESLGVPANDIEGWIDGTRH